MEMRHKPSGEKYIEYPEESFDIIDNILSEKVNVEVKKKKGEYLCLMDKLLRLCLIVGLTSAIIFILIRCIPLMF